MRDLITRLLPALACVALLLVTIAAPGSRAAGSSDDKAPHYVCPPCGMKCDTRVFDHPGTCPECGSRLVRQGEDTAPEKTHKTVAILIFNGVEIIDYTGPYEVFGAADFDVYTVAETKEPVTTAMGMTVVPKYSFAEAPQPDILVVPGGDVRAPRASSATLKWVADRTARTTHTMSVCNGAFILAHAGLLDGLGATTTSRLIDLLQKEFPKVKTIHDQRFVDNGKIITAAGLSSGIDGALHVVAKVLGEGTAQQVALGIEYDWRPRSGFARAALADRLIPDLDLDELGMWEIVRTEGGTDRWEMVARATSRLSAAELRDRIGEGFVAQGKWTKVPPASRDKPAARLASDWSFRGRDGAPWVGRLTVEPIAGERGRYTLSLAIHRTAIAVADDHRSDRRTTLIL